MVQHTTAVLWELLLVAADVSTLDFPTPDAIERLPLSASDPMTVLRHGESIILRRKASNAERQWQESERDQHFRPGSRKSRRERSWLRRTDPTRAQVMATWPEEALGRLRREFDITLIGAQWGYLHPRAHPQAGEFGELTPRQEAPAPSAGTTEGV